jgi:hypothetical protein
MYGAAHLAFLPEPLNQEVDVYYSDSTTSTTTTTAMGGMTTMSSYFSIALNEFTVHPNTATTATSSSIGSSRINF